MFHPNCTVMHWGWPKSIPKISRLQHSQNKTLAKIIEIHSKKDKGNIFFLLNANRYANQKLICDGCPLLFQEVSRSRHSPNSPHRQCLEKLTTAEKKPPESLQRPGPSETIKIVQLLKEMFIYVH